MNIFFDLLTIFSSNILFFLVLWAVIYNFSRITWVDFLWSTSIGAWSLFHIMDEIKNENVAAIVLCSVSLLWSLRLSSHLLQRIAESKGEDPRYEKIIKESKKHWIWKSLLIFLMNALLASILLVPQRLLILSGDKSLSILQLIGAIISFLAILGEGTADIQLKNFIKHHRGKTCKKGLWRYSRHPNYFFEWLFWVGVSLFVLKVEYGYWALSAPILIFLFLNYFTGIKLTEKNAEKKRPDFAAYKEKTSSFFLWFPG